MSMRTANTFLSQAGGLYGRYLWQVSGERECGGKDEQNQQVYRPVAHERTITVEPGRRPRALPVMSRSVTETATASHALRGTVTRCPSTYSTTASSRSSLYPDGFPETANVKQAHARRPPARSGESNSGPPGGCPRAP